jgi:hypothetical protein
MECNYSDLSRSFNLSEEKQSLLTDLTLHKGWKVYEQLANTLIVKTIDSIVDVKAENIDFKRGKIHALDELKREIKIIVSKHLKQKQKV